jgi:hypothetical protein
MKKYSIILLSLTRIDFRAQANRVKRLWETLKDGRRISQLKNKYSYF